MGDIITFTCILKKSSNPGEPDTLALAISKTDGDNGYREIPCHPVGAKVKPKPSMPNVMWEYRVSGNQLHLTPSLFCPSVNFHTDYNWSVAFVECPELKDEMELFAETNPTWESGW